MAVFKQLFSNNAETVLEYQITAGDNVIQVPLGKGDLFRGPVPELGQYQLLTLADGVGYEVVKMWGRGSRVPQITYLYPAGVITPGLDFTITLYDDDDMPYSIIYTCTSNTVSSVVSGIYNLWRAQGTSPWNRFTVTDSTSYLIIQCNIPGLPFTMGLVAEAPALVSQTTPQTAVSGQGDQMNVYRSQEGTVAKQWEAGTIVSGRVTRGTMEYMQNEILDLRQYVYSQTYVPRPLYLDMGDRNTDFEIDINAAETIRFRVTAAVVNVAMTGGVLGQSCKICIVQDTTGGRDVNFTNITRWSEGATPVLIGLANRMDVVGVIYSAVEAGPTYVGMAYTLNL
jgi:hypothetical protein